MTLNDSKGNMYEFITHTWNPIKGKCFHDCAYCYMKSLVPNPKPIHIVESELTGTFPDNAFIFIDSSADLFAEDVESEWIKKVLDFCVEGTNHSQAPNKARFLVQTKNPQRIFDFIDHPIFSKERKQAVVCTTIETNRHHPEIMNNAPLPQDRAKAMAEISKHGIPTYVTIEPIIDFDLDELVSLIKLFKPEQVNIGKDSKNFVELPLPDWKKLVLLILQLLCFTKVNIKKNIDGEKVEKALKIWFNHNMFIESE